MVHVSRRKRGGASRKAIVLVALAIGLIVPAAAWAAFPGTNPDESVRNNAPNDPDFDRCEPDNEGGQTCTNPYDQEVERFGFAPSGSQATALYNPAALPARQSAQNIAAGRNPLGQVSGISADRAYKYFGQDDPNGPVGDPEVEIAILDTGIRWDRGELRSKIALNEDELPRPQIGATPCPTDDCNNDGAFNVDDYANDPRVSITGGHNEADSILDASDLIARFSEGGDEDGNGFIDDIAGWDFFDDDNDPYDASSYSAGSNHGSGRAEEAGGATNNGQSGTGVCPACQIVPMRVWDTFVVDTNQFAMAVMYAADNDIEVVEGAVGGLLNSRFARETFDYAYSKGTLPVIVSSDLNTADHNFPTTYNESLHIQGTVADTHGLGENPPDEFIDFFNDFGGLQLGTNVPIGTWFRNSGTTQYGGHAHLVTVAVTGSMATGQAAGAAGLIYSFGNRKGLDLTPNEVKQLMTLTSEDVKALNTVGTGTPDPAQDGWDQHFGYGRLDLGAAVEAIRDDEVRPEALITSPDWFAPLNVADQQMIQVRARMAADRAPVVAGARFQWSLQWAPGLEPCEADFNEIANGVSADQVDTVLGSVNLTTVRAALDARTNTSSCGNPPAPVTGGSTFDPTAPTPGPGDADPNEPAFTVRVVVNDTDGNRGEDRKVLFAYEDTSLADGWSRPIGGKQNVNGHATTGGESSHRMYDLDGDNDLEIIEATSGGEIHVLSGDGSHDPDFNGGQPVKTRLYPNVHPGSDGFASVDPPNEPLRVPAIGDIDGDLEPEIVDSGGEHVYAWERDGSVVDGFPVRVDPALSAVPLRTKVNHIKRGFLASPALGDLDGDGDKEIAIAALDQHLYVWEGDGSPRSGFPVYLRPREESGGPVPCSGEFECAEAINTPAIGDITGDGVPEIVAPTNEFNENANAPGLPASLGGFSGLLTNFLADQLGGSGRVYAVDADGEFVPGWPIALDGLLPDVLPFVGPGVDPVMADLDDDGEYEVISNVASGDLSAYQADGSASINFDSQPASGEHVDKSKIINLFENPVVANLDGSGGLEVMKGGMSLIGAVNLGVLVGQNLPYNHTLQAWETDQGTSLPAYPQAVEDYQLLSSPAVADVSDAPGNEALVGTGLYYIRNLNSTGIEGSGWPKFTGGWNFAVPSVGDVDGDGSLEVVSQTREGFSFMWETGGEACDGGNDEWWTSRHDEFNSGAYGTDSRPPGSPIDLTIEGDDLGVTVNWEVPGDDWLCGDPDHLRVVALGDGKAPGRRSAGPTDGQVLINQDITTRGGSSTSRRFNRGQLDGADQIGVLYRDEAGNWGLMGTVDIPQVDPPDPPIGTSCLDVILGGSGPDELTGTAGPERIRGRGGDDEIRGLDGGDCLNGGGGEDFVIGGAGDDRLGGSSGDDRLYGSPGDDIGRGGGGIDRVKGGAGDDNLRGQAGEDIVTGGAGDDKLRGGADPDRVRGSGGNDRIDVRAGGVDTVTCGKGVDRVRAGRRDIVERGCEKVRIRR